MNKPFSKKRKNKSLSIFRSSSHSSPLIKADQYFKHDVESDPNQEYDRFALLRRVMLMVVESLGQSGSAHQLEFDNLLLIIHYYALRAAMKTLTGLGKIRELDFT